MTKSLKVTLDAELKDREIVSIPSTNLKFGEDGNTAAIPQLMQKKNAAMTKIKLLEGKKRSMSTSSSGSTDTAFSNPLLPPQVKKLRKTSSSNISISSAASCGASVGKCPPRDMKRLKKGAKYTVTRVAKWGDKLAVFLKNAVDERDHGFFKPPEAFKRANFHVGDLVSLESVGYSASRNRIAQTIAIEPSADSTCLKECVNPYGSEGGCCTASVLATIEERPPVDINEVQETVGVANAGELSALMGLNKVGLFSGLFYPQLTTFNSGYPVIPQFNHQQYFNQQVEPQSQPPQLQSQLQMLASMSNEAYRKHPAVVASTNKPIAALPNGLATTTPQNPLDLFSALAATQQRHTTN